MTTIGKIHSIESFGTVDGPGIRLVVFLQGCPLRCLYCHNPDTWDVNQGTKMSVEEILEIYHRNSAFYRDGGITVSGGEPLYQLEFVVSLFKEAKKRGIHTTLDTSGICFKDGELYHQLVKVCDLVLLDIKHIDSQAHIKLCGQNNEHIKAFLTFLNQHRVEVSIRHVYINEYYTDDKALHDLGIFIGQFENVKALEVLPYHTMGNHKYQELNLSYPLSNLKNTTNQAAIEARKKIIQGMKEIKNIIK